MDETKNDGCVPFYKLLGNSKMATTTAVEQSKQEALEAYEEATAMMWKMAEGNPLISALMREDQEEVDRLMDQTMMEVREELEELMMEEEQDKKRSR